MRQHRIVIGILIAAFVALLGAVSVFSQTFGQHGGDMPTSRFRIIAHETTTAFGGMKKFSLIQDVRSGACWWEVENQGGATYAAFVTLAQCTP